ncbi:fimbrial protein [Salmonella enterica subsp. enterica serovar Choleraesuis]|nr:fimbrial protein [Salmonella enterica subsp. enterica serovar Choleraesuis]
MEVELGASGSSKIQVLSQSNEVQFIKIKPKKIINPGTKQETEAEVDASENSALIVTPQKIALTAGGERLIRLISMALPEKETTWRVYFEGVSEQKYSGEIGGDDKKGSAEVGVSIIWGALVHVAPKTTVVGLTYNSQTGEVSNTGTIRLPLRELAVCNNEKDCVWTKETMTIYPDMHTKLKSFTYSPGKIYRVKYYNWIKNSVEEMALSVSSAH